MVDVWRVMLWSVKVVVGGFVVVGFWVLVEIVWELGVVLMVVFFIGWMIIVDFWVSCSKEIK